MAKSLITQILNGIGHLTESAIFSQWQHSPQFRNLRYARWRSEGEVDIVFLAGAQQAPIWIGEIKWSDRIAKHQDDEIKSMQVLLKQHSTIKEAFFTTKTVDKEINFEVRPFWITPSSLYCYTVGRNITTSLTAPIGGKTT